MRIATVTVTLLALCIAGCSSKSTEPAPKTDAVAKADAETPAAEPSDAATQENSDEEGCIYAEGHKDDADAELGCPHGPGEPGAAEGNDGHFGSPFALTEPKALAEVLAAGASEEPVLVRGEVEAVCQKKGCWMVIKDGAEKARILMKDHGFAVPMDSRGKTALVEGTLASRTFDEAQVKHLAKDGGEDPAEVSGSRTEHVLTATGIKIQSQS